MGHKNFVIRMSGVIVGAIIYYFVYQTVVFLGFDTDLLKMLAAIVVAAFIGVPYVVKKVRGRAEEAR